MKRWLSNFSWNTKMKDKTWKYRCYHQAHQLSCCRLAPLISNRLRNTTTTVSAFNNALSQSTVLVSVGPELQLLPYDSIFSSTFSLGILLANQAFLLELQEEFLGHRQVICPQLSLKLNRVRRKCTICQQLVKKNQIMAHLRCKHVFHANCLSKWQQRSNRCPLCRKKMV